MPESSVPRPQLSLDPSDHSHILTSVNSVIVVIVVVVIDIVVIVVVNILFRQHRSLPSEPYGP